MKTKRKKNPKQMWGVIAVIVIAVAVVGGLIFTGHLQLGGQAPIVYGSEEEVSGAITSISGDMEDVSSILEEIDQTLG